MRISSLPFAFVFGACLLPLAGAALDRPVYHLPALILASGVIVVLFSTSARLAGVADRTLMIPVVTMLALMAIHVRTGRGFVILGGGGYPLLFTAVFLWLFRCGRGLDIPTAERGVTLLYKFFTIALGLEFLMLMLDPSLRIGALLASTRSGEYRTFLFPDFPPLLGLFPDGRGLNSVLLGPQIASMVSLFAAIWFASRRSCVSTRRGRRASNWWIGASLFLFVMATKGTGVFLFVLGGGLYYLFVRPRQRLAGIVAAGLLVGAFYFMVAHGGLLQRIFSTDEAPLSAAQIEMFSSYGIDTRALSKVGFYLLLFQSPVFIWLSLGWPAKILGLGAAGFTAADAGAHVSGDFGFATDVLLKPGLVWTLVFVTTIGVICFPALRLAGHVAADGHAASWRQVGSTNALIALLWLVSSTHYNPAMGNAGGMTLFALHLALALQGRRRAGALAA